MRWWTILMVLSAVPSLLRGESLPVRAYTTADGLAADRIDCIVPDSRGFLWFCTPEGLSRFDGYHFISYGTQEGLPSRTISTVIETRAGEYFVGTSHGISRIKPTGQGARFATYMPFPEAAKNYIADLRESRSGKIWCATLTGLFEWSQASGFRSIPLPLPQGIAISSLVEDSRGDLWVGTIRGIYVLRENAVTQTFTTKEGLPGDWVEMLLIDSHGKMWAALRGGLARIGRGTDGRWMVEKVYTDKTGLVASDVKALLEASDGTLWVGTSLGISRLRLGAGEPVVLENLTRVRGLSDRSITSLAEDRAGNIWAGTEGAGAMRIDRLGFTTYREQDGFPTDRLFSVFEDRAGELVAVTLGGTHKRTLEVFDGMRFHTVAPKPFADHPNWGSNQVVLQSRTGEWWAATKKGLCRYPVMKARNLDRRNPQACYSQESEIFQIFEDSRGGIWASAQSRQGDQLMRWDPKSDAVHRFPAPWVPGAPINELVSAFGEDRQGNIWMGAHRGGLYRYDGRSFNYFQQKDGVPGGLIFALLSGEAGLWIASNGGGLGHIVNTGDERPRVEVYDSRRGMASDLVQCLAEDRQGRIYAGTTKGVNRLDPKTGHIRHFSSGLAHGDCTAATRDRSGSLWFATRQGLSKLIPTADRPVENPPVFITNLRIGGAPYQVSELGETHISRLELKPSQNQLQVEFVGLDYEPGDVLRYSYRLDGADSAWSPPSSQLSVNYAALTAGKYRFLVKAVTSEGAESSSPAEIEFTVLPPLWNRWWFEGLTALLAASLVFFAHRYRVTQMVNLERMRTAIATDLHDDIGSSLSHIAVLSEVARAGLSDENQRTHEALQRVAALARDLVDSLGDVVWSIRAVPDNLDSLVRRMREFGLDLLTGQNIDFELRFPLPERVGQPLSLQARRHLFLMFKECMHNVSRHSGCTAVKAELKIVENEILLTVVDNGRGFDPDGELPRSSGGHGVTGMRQRAESLGGAIQFVSSPGKGCAVSIKIPLRRSPFTKYRV